MQLAHLPPQLLIVSPQLLHLQPHSAQFSLAACWCCFTWWWNMQQQAGVVHVVAVAKKLLQHKVTALCWLIADKQLEPGRRGSALIAPAEQATGSCMGRRSSMCTSGLCDRVLPSLGDDPAV